MFVQLYLHIYHFFLALHTSGISDFPSGITVFFLPTVHPFKLFIGGIVDLQGFVGFGYTAK